MSKNKKDKKQFTGVDLSNINTSMELDSGQELARLYDGDLCATLKVVGDVRVIYEDEIYKAPSQFPEELMKLFHDGKADKNHGVEIAFNNWFEVFVWKVWKDDKGNEKLDFAGLSDTVDVERNTPGEICGLLADCIKECRNNHRFTLNFHCNMTPQNFISRALSLIPRDSQVYLDVNILDESTLASLKDGVDVKIDTVANVAGQIWIFGYPDNNSDAQQAFEPAAFKEGLDRILDDAECILEHSDEDADTTSIAEGVELFVVTETVQDYKGACTNCYGVSKNPERALSIMRESISERFSCEERFSDEEEPEKAMSAFIDGYFTNPEKTGWRYFDGDTEYTFEIHKTKLS